jgi:hypothetical protein
VAGWQELDDETVRGLLTAMRDLDWGWTPGEADDVLRRLGLIVTYEDPDKGAVGRTPVDIGRENVSVLYGDGRVRYVSIGVTERGTAPPGLDSVLRADQVFERVREIGRELVAEPVMGARGEERFAYWRGERATITLWQSTYAVFLEWAPNEYADEELKTAIIAE